jgi:hypothetical protein
MLFNLCGLPFTAIDLIGFVAVAAVVAVAIATGLARRGRRARHPALSLPESA